MKLFITFILGVLIGYILTRRKTMNTNKITVKKDYTTASAAVSECYTHVKESLKNHLDKSPSKIGPEIDHVEFREYVQLVATVNGHAIPDGTVRRYFQRLRAKDRKFASIEVIKQVA